MQSKPSVEGMLVSGLEPFGLGRAQCPGVQAWGPCGLSSSLMLLVQVPGMTHPGPWFLALRLQDRGVDLTRTLQNVDGQALFSWTLLCAHSYLGHHVLLLCSFSRTSCVVVAQ